jgi:ferrous iron transport protein B
MKMEIALFGNPNSGKTTLFNELTGDSRSVGNWTGTTVKLDIGHFHYKKQAFDIVDMPGIYSLLTHSPEQIAGCEYLLNYHPDAIINIVDSTNLERNLYLTTQLIEAGIPMVVALNMDDEMKDQGIYVDAKLLSQLLGVPCIKISATRNRGLAKLLDTVLAVVANPGLCDSDKIVRQFSPDLQQELEKIIGMIDDTQVPDHLDRHWIGLQMMKEHWQGELPAELQGQGDVWEAKIGEERYRIISDIVKRVKKVSPILRRQQVSKKIDALVCHRYLALPIFLVVMFAIFFLAFGPVGNIIYQTFNYLFNVVFADLATKWLAAANSGPVVTGMIIDGIIAGVGAVMVFLPQLTILFFCLALLEFSGYIARAAFITDKLLAKFGLSGMSFIPMVLGFGCSVPAIMACRSLHNKGERLLTMMIIPFMSCSARMTVYALFAAAFFAEKKYLIIFALYALGIVMAFITAVILSPMLMKKEKPVFLMVMPPYRIPVWHCVWRSVWVRVWDFISHAGTVLLIASIVVWFLSNFSASLQMVEGNKSLLSNIGQTMAPLFAPLGFGYWQIAVALILGFMSKEAVISTLAVLYAGTSSLALALTSVITPVAAFALLVFVLLYTPCLATLTAMRRESDSWRSTLFMMAYQFGVAWLLSFAIYHILMLFA